ncbi:MAG: integrase core domain-containing protein, partial [Planctomycetes bacterium]|nr:integrase core domain-containing protein [Planctomycetota bacterium]
MQRFLREKPRRRPSAAPTKAPEASADTVPFNILRPTKPNRTWHLDLTTIRVLWLTLHVAMLLDGFSRKLLALRVFRSEPKSREIARLVRRAYKDHGQARFIVTDHGGQFRTAFKKRVEIRGTEVVKGKVRSCTFNGKAERFFKTMKLWQRVTLIFASLVDVQKKLDIYRTWFNEERIHQGIGGLTPEEAWSGTKRPAPKAFLAADNY